jgi:hypothetical protein
MQAAGINLSAFGSTRRPLVAIAQYADGDVRVELRPAAMLSRNKLSDSAAETFATWRTGMLELPRPIGVDVALDLGELRGSSFENREKAVPEPRTSNLESRLFWELSYRPIDFAFYGDAPATDKIGEFGLRFRTMLAGGGFELGSDLIEAFPRATVELLEFKGQYLGGSAHHGHNGWKADDKNQRADKLLAKLFQELGVNPGQGAEKLTSDDLDAILCALTALGAARSDGLLSAAALVDEIAQRCARRANTGVNDAHKAPQHIAVLSQPFWSTIAVTRALA